MKRALTASAMVLSGTFGVAAQAQEVTSPNYFQKAMVAPDRAFELNVGAAYNQGWGDLTDSVSAAGETFGRKVQDVAGAGIAFEIDLGYRSSPGFAAGLYGTLAFFSNQTDVSGTGVRSLTVGFQGVWYAQPFRAFNPWLALGTGYRASWLLPDVGDNTLRQGWELGRLQFGTDFRLSREVAISPYVGFDVNAMFSETLPNSHSRSLDGPPVFASFTAGVMGRFDAGGTYRTSGGGVGIR